MADTVPLNQLKDERFFTEWDGFVTPQRIEAAEASLGQLIDELVSLGTDPAEALAREVVDHCVLRFNGIDDGWICTIERETIFEQIAKVVDLCGFDCEEDWLGERDW